MKKQDLNVYFTQNLSDLLQEGYLIKPDDSSYGYYQRIDLIHPSDPEHFVRLQIKYEYIKSHFVSYSYNFKILKAHIKNTFCSSFNDDCEILKEKIFYEISPEYIIDDYNEFVRIEELRDKRFDLRYIPKSYSKPINVSHKINVSGFKILKPGEFTLERVYVRGIANDFYNLKNLKNGKEKQVRIK